MAKKKVALLNPHSYERIDNGRFYVGSHLAGRMRGEVGMGYIWKSEYGYQGWDSDQTKAIRRMRKIYWYETLRRCDGE
jgi:hypothetical protein